MDQYPELGLTSGMRIELNSQQVIDRAVERIMEHLGEREQVKQWILDYVREQIEESERWDISNGMKSLGNHIYEDAYQKQHESETSINKVEQAKALKTEADSPKTEEGYRGRDKEQEPGRPAVCGTEHAHVGRHQLWKKLHREYSPEGKRAGYI